MEGKISSIVSKRGVFINRGSGHGVVEGMIFGVIQKLPIIVDTDDQDSYLIGEEIVIGTLRVKKIYENMSFTILQPLVDPDREAKKWGFTLPPVSKEDILERPITRGDIVRLQEE